MVEMSWVWYNKYRKEIIDKGEFVMEKNNIGKTIKYLRKFHGEKQIELANELGVTKSSICDYEHGRREPDTETLEKIALHYGITLDDIIRNKLYESAGIDSSKIVDKHHGKIHVTSEFGHGSEFTISIPIA